MSHCGVCRQPVVWLHLQQSTVAVEPSPDRDTYRVEKVYGNLTFGRPVGPTHRRHRCPESPDSAGDAGMIKPADLIKLATELERDAT